MEFYFVVLFFHITSAFTLFMGMAIEWIGLSRIQLAVNREQMNEWVKFLSSLKFLFITAGILLIVTGAYMASSKWGWTPWMLVSLIIWIYLAIHGSLVTLKKVKKFGQYLNSNLAMSNADLHGHLIKLKLINFLQSEVAVGIGAIFIMTVKPDLVGSIGVILVAIILGIAPLLFKRKTYSARLTKV